MDRSDSILQACFFGALIAIILAVSASRAGGGDLAQWVEAFGVIGAIFGSVLVATWQYRRGNADDLARAYDEKIRVIRDLSRLVFKIRTFLERLPNWANLGAQAKILPDDVTPDQAMVLSWLLYESNFGRLDDFGMIDVLADLRARLHKIQDLLNVQFDFPNSHGYLQANRQVAATISTEALKNCASFLMMASDYMARGGPPEPPED